MSTPLVVALNVLSLVTGGPTIVAKHAAPEPSPTRSQRTDNRHHTVKAAKCPHGHFARWAANNCKACNK